MTNPVSLITGGGAGIGRAVALRLATDGHHVVIGEIDDARSASVVDEIKSAGGTASAFHLDVGDVDATRKTIADIVYQIGPIDGLVNNAGVTKGASMFDIETSDFDWMFNINSRGAFFVLQAVARQMVERKSGRIVNLASIAAKGYRGVSNIVYAATKGSVISMTRVGSLELAPYGVTMNAICPGPTRTEIFKEVVEKVGEEAVDRVRGLIPLGRLNDPSDIAAMAAFLLSDDARNITGQCINVDGGIVYD